MDQQLKERLVGAVVLVAAGIVFIPMILSGAHERDRPPPRAVTPPAAARPAGGFSSRIVPLAKPGAAAPGSGASATSGREPARDAARRQDPAPVAPAVQPPQTSATAPATSPAASLPRAPQAGPVASSGSGPRAGWVVQLGSFASARNAHALRDRLTESGFAAFAESSGSGAQAVTRVYVGPEPDRERAEGHVAKLLEQTRLKGIVVRYPGE